VPNDGASTGSRTRPVLATSIVGGVVLLDLVSKVWAVHELSDGPVDLVGDDIGFHLARNTGGAFSLFQGFTPLLAVVAGVVAYFLVRTVRRTHDTLLVVALSLVLGGALGNLIDRIFRSPGFLRGAVVDFVHVGSFPTFNVADAAITVGAALVVVWALWGSEAHR
jgi:signal peptidase II